MKKNSKRRSIYESICIVILVKTYKINKKGLHTLYFSVYLRLYLYKKKAKAIRLFFSCFFITISNMKKSNIKAVPLSIHILKKIITTNNNNDNDNKKISVSQFLFTYFTFLTLTLHIQEHLDGLGLGLVRLVDGHAAQGCVVVRLGEGVLQHRHGHPRLVFLHLLYAGLTEFVLRKRLVPWHTHRYGKVISLVIHKRYEQILELFRETTNR